MKQSLKLILMISYHQKVKNVNKGGIILIKFTFINPYAHHIFQSLILRIATNLKECHYGTTYHEVSYGYRDSGTSQ